MTKKELFYVITVADEKNISRAAKKLYMAQPSLSQSIQRIEEKLGTALFNRSLNGLTLTFAGERYYHMATEILKRYEDFEMEISDINNLKIGKIHVGITNHLGTLTLAKVLPQYKEICPNIEIYIHEENSVRLEQMLLSSKIDFAVMHAPKILKESQITYDILNRDPFVIAISPKHPLLEKAEEKSGYPFPVLDLHFLKDEPFLMLHKEQRIRQITDAILARANIHQPKTVMTLRNFETAQLLAAQGIGVTLIPLQYTQIPNAEHKPALLCIDDEYDASWNLCIASVKNSFLTKADLLFIRIVKDFFSENPN